MLLNEVFEHDLPCILFEDNEAAVYLAKNQHVSSRTKHIDIRQHYVREHLKKLGEVRAIRFEENFADILTKNVAVSIFNKLSVGLLNGFDGFNDSFLFLKHQRENI